MTVVQNQGNQQVSNMAAMPKQAAPQPIQQQMPQGMPPIMPQQVATQQMVQPAPQPMPQQMPVYATNPSQTTPPPSYAGVNIQIYNPSVGVPNINPTGTAPVSQGLPGCAYPPNYYTNQWGQQNGVPQPPQATAQPPQAPAPEPIVQTSSTVLNKEVNTTENKSDKKTEKRKVVELSDDYIKNLENYLNSQDQEVRLMGAKEVVARLQEDDSRSKDPALTALTNKMLQDPSQQIRFLALSMLDSRMVEGDDFSVKVLQNMQNSTAGYGQDAIQATNILLKMSGKTVEKEFEVKDSKSDKSESKK